MLALEYLGHRCPPGGSIVPWYFAGSLTLTEGQRFPIGPEGLVIGRGRNADVRVASNGVARAHARVRLIDGGEAVRLEDLMSGNGTHIGGRTITDEVLRAGDTFSVAGYFDFAVVAAD